MGAKGPLRFGVDGDGFLTVVARRPGRGATLRFRPDGLQVVAPRGEELVLAWERFCDVATPAYHANGWTYGEYTIPEGDNAPSSEGAVAASVWAAVIALVTRGQSVYATLGCAVHVWGSDKTAAARVRTAAVPRRRRWYATAKDFALIPVAAAPLTNATSEIATLGALSGLLRDRPELRERLDDRSRMTRLTDAVAGGLRTHRNFPAGHRRDTIDTLTAMRLAGAVHPYGRPLRAGEHGAFASLADAVTAVRARLDANPYRSGRASDPARVEMLVREHFWDVEPWPFGALLD